MAIFTYKAIKEDGSSYKGKMEAVNQYAVKEKIESAGEQVVFIEKGKEGSWVKRFTEKFDVMFGKVKEHEKILFARNLGLMIRSGLSLSRALSVLERQTRNKLLKKVLADLQDSIGQGSSFNESLADFPKVFPDLFVSMVAAGEQSGNLSQSLQAVSDQMERTYLIKKKIKGAMVYPAVILGLIGVLGILMLYFVVPTLTSTFNDLGVELPLSTRIIIGISDFLRYHTIVTLGILLLVVGAVVYVVKQPWGKRGVEFLLLKLPLFSPITKEINAARTVRTLASLLSSGVEYVESIRITRDVVQNSYYREVLEEAEKRVQKGEPISKVFLAYENLYPVFVGEMASVGEETGNLSEMFGNVADFYEEDVQEKTKNMSTLIEPLLMAVIGVFVGIFAISMLTPTYSLVDAI